MENGQSFQSISTSNRNINMNEKRWKTNPTQKSTANKEKERKQKTRYHSEWIQNGSWKNAIRCSRNLDENKKKKMFFFLVFDFVCFACRFDEKTKLSGKESTIDIFIEIHFWYLCRPTRKKQTNNISAKNRIYSDYLERNAI